MRFVEVGSVARSGVAVALLAIAFASPGNAVDAAGIGGARLDLPASFVRDSDCSGCAGATLQLDLWPDGVFHLSRPGSSPAGPDGAQVGRWRLAPDTAELLLYGGHEAPLRFSLADDGSLLALDGAGQPPVTGRAVAWRARESFAPADLELRLHGMYTGDVAAQRFEECLTGRTYTVAQGRDQAALAREYAALAAKAPGTPVLASFDGTLRPSPVASQAPSVVVQRLTGLWPGQSCERAMSHASLSNQYWRVERLRGQRLEPALDAGDMYVILRGDAGGYVANAGCGRFTGTYRVDGPTISFAAAATRPECPAQLAGRQQQLQSVLAAAAGWAIQGQVLELFDAAGRSLAALEAVYFN
jgi:copper homeostasis protein (lipoprotein)